MKKEKLRKIRVYITKADYDKAMKEVNFNSDTVYLRICTHCVVSQAIRRTFDKLKLFPATFIHTNTTNVCDETMHIIALMPEIGKTAIHDFDAKLPFIKGRQFTLELLRTE